MIVIVVKKVANAFVSRTRHVSYMGHFPLSPSDTTTWATTYTSSRMNGSYVAAAVAVAPISGLDLR
jgi:hypothetical protein